MEISCDKMIFAVLSGDDSADAIQDLNRSGYCVTVLASSGGFLRKRSVTLLIGLEAERVDAALAILKKHGGARLESAHYPVGTAAGVPTLPVQAQVGGDTAFVLDVVRGVKF